MFLAAGMAYWAPFVAVVVGYAGGAVWVRGQWRAHLDHEGLKRQYRQTDES